MIRRSRDATQGQGRVPPWRRLVRYGWRIARGAAADGDAACLAIYVAFAATMMLMAMQTLPPPDGSVAAECDVPTGEQRFEACTVPLTPPDTPTTDVSLAFPRP